MKVENQYSGKTILVTGGAGAIGSALVCKLIRAGAGKVIVLDDMSSGYAWNISNDDSVEVWNRSILDDVTCDRLRSTPIQYVFHLAALFANQNSIDNSHRDLLVNGLGTLRMLEVARDLGVKRFVYASSSSSFSKTNAPLPLREDFLSLKLDTPYQITKLLGEYYCNFFLQHWEVPTVSIRLFNSYGPGEVPGKYRNVIPNFMYWALSGLPLPITGTGEETRDFTYVDDIVEGALAAGCASGVCGQAFNLASAKETRIVDLATMVNEVTGNKAGIVFKARRDWDHTSRRWASIDRAKAQLGYQPKVQLQDGLLNTVQWFREHWTQIQASITQAECARASGVHDAA